MKNIKKIDIHAHAVAFPQYVPDCFPGGRFCSADEVISFYDRLNIEKGVLLPITAPDAMQYTMTSEACKYIVDQNPDRFVWFCGVDPRSFPGTDSDSMLMLLNHYKKLGARGVGELTANLYADDARVENLFACCAELDMPVTIHMTPHNDGTYGIVDRLGMPRLEKMLKRYPRLKIFGHSQVFWSEISADNDDTCRWSYPTGKVTDGTIARLLREYPNLFCDLSAGSGMNALRRDPEYAARFIEEFSDRLLYGCDICAVWNTHPFEFCDFLDGMLEKGMISEENYCKMVRENAVRLLNLEA